MIIIHKGTRMVNMKDRKQTNELKDELFILLSNLIMSVGRSFFYSVSFDREISFKELIDSNLKDFGQLFQNAEALT